MSRYFTLLLTVLSFLLAVAAHAQVVLKGVIKDDKGVPVSGAGVSLENTLDGTTSDTAGNFILNTTEKGEQVLAVTAIGYEPVSKPVNLDQLKG